MFIVEDQNHCQYMGKYETYEAAIEKLNELSRIPWDQEPNRCPCRSWRTCEREYVIIEGKNENDKWVQISRTNFLKISYAGVEWLTQ
ncbi:MAG: hypothetical protein PQJ46_07440 [Spirochaetales bacterium]|nr:hypothetical protein [Spirochaetales bacterium]